MAGREPGLQPPGLLFHIPGPGQPRPHKSMAAGRLPDPGGSFLFQSCPKVLIHLLLTRYDLPAICPSTPGPPACGSIEMPAIGVLRQVLLAFTMCLRYFYKVIATNKSQPVVFQADTISDPIRCILHPKIRRCYVVQIIYTGFSADAQQPHRADVSCSLPGWLYPGERPA